MENDSNDTGTSVRISAAVTVDSGGDPPQKKRGCCSTLRFEGEPMARGWMYGAVARGGITMSNIFLSTALIRLASLAAGCDVDLGDECLKEVYGFRPSSLITIIAALQGGLAACLVPYIGAIVDYTAYRRAVGIASSVFLVVSQGLQIWLTDDTWFPMAMLQALAGFAFMVQTTVTLAYLPDISQTVSESTMIKYTAVFVQSQFSGSLVYLIANVGLQLALGLEEIPAAQVSQGICVAWMLVTLVPMWGWLLPPMPALNPHREGRGLFVLGFSQVWRTCKGINEHYRGSLRWFFLATVFSEAGAAAFATVSVTYMAEVLRMDGTAIGVAFIVVLAGTLPGAKLGEIVSQRANPVFSWKANALVFTLATLAGSLVLTGPDRVPIMYALAATWGALLGWYYPATDAVFALAVPKGQEAELAGFFNYCRSILVWLPPLVFTLMNEGGIHMRWGLVTMCSFLLAGAGFLFLMDPWEEVVEASKVNQMAIENERRVSIASTNASRRISWGSDGIAKSREEA